MQVTQTWQPIMHCRNTEQNPFQSAPRLDLSGTVSCQQTGSGCLWAGWACEPVHTSNSTSSHSRLSTPQVRGANFAASRRSSRLQPAGLVAFNACGAVS